MSVRLSWEAGQRPLSEEDARAAVQAALDHGGRGTIDVDVILAGDGLLAELHGRFLDDPTPTDVLAFDLTEQGLAEKGPAAEGPGVAAEIYVSVERAIEVARERGVQAARELALYLVHGALHLCGFDDHETAQRSAMRAAENEILEALGYPPDPLPHDR